MKTIVEVAQNLIKPFINSEDKKYAANIAPVETSPATAAHTAGTQLIYNGVLYNVTANIATDDPLATTGAGANIAVADKVTEQISSQKQALSDEVVTRASLGAHNLAPITLKSAIDNASSSGSWSGNVYTVSGMTFTFNSSENGYVDSVVVGGTPTGSSNKFFKMLGGLKLPAGTYILSGCPSGGTAGYTLYVGDGTTNYFDEGNGKQFTTDGTKEFSVTIRVLGTYSLTSDLTFRPMIKKVEDADTTFRPYVPTNAELLSYKDNGVLGAKNLLDATVSTWTSTAGENKSQTVGEIYLKAGTSIVFTVKQETNMTSNTRNTIIVTPKGQSANAVVEDNTANYMLSAGTHKMTYTAPADHTYVFSIWCHTPNVAITYSDFMVRLATDTDPTYQPYAKTNRELTEVAQQVEGGYIRQSFVNNVNVTADGVKDYQTLENELKLAFDSYCESHPDEYIEIRGVKFNTTRFNVSEVTAVDAEYHNTSHGAIYGIITSLSLNNPQGYIMGACRLHTTKSNCSYYVDSNGTFTDRTNEVPESGIKLHVYFSVYKQIS